MNTLYQTVIQNTSVDAVLESMGVEAFTPYLFSVVATTRTGAILQSLDNPAVEGFLFCSLSTGCVCSCSIRKVKLDQWGNPRITLRLESVKSYTADAA